MSTRPHNVPPTFASLTVGQPVQVHAFGCWYAGTITKKGPKRVTVRFCTSTHARLKVVGTIDLAPAGRWRVANREDGAVPQLREGETLETYDMRGLLRVTRCVDCRGVIVTGNGIVCTAHGAGK